MLSELLYSASNLLVLLNDTFIRKVAGIELKFVSTYDTGKVKDVG